MAKVVVVTSGKGGVGKTTSTAALGAALARPGKNVVVVDFDVGLRNLDLVMGAERRVVFDLINVVQGHAKLTQALIRDKRLVTLYLLPASQTRDKDALTEDGVAAVIAELRTRFDWVICDSPAGIERGATLAMRFADEAVIVTNPEVSSVRDSDRIIGLLDSKTLKAELGEGMMKHLLITRFDPLRASRGEMLNIQDVLEILSIPLLGIIPENEEVLRASNFGAPVTICGRNSAPSRAYFDAARRLAGEEVEMTIPTERRSLFTKLFRRRAALETVPLSSAEELGAGGARAATDPARIRAQLGQPDRPHRGAARGDPRRGRPPRHDRSGQGPNPSGPPRRALDPCGRNPDSQRDTDDRGSA